MPEPTVPPFHGNVSFNAQHAPMGAFFSFTCGHFGTRGGFGLQIGKPGNQDLYIGVKDGDRFSDAPLKCLPFHTGGRSGAGAAADFQVEQAAGPAEQNVKPKVVAYTKDEIKRHYGWATDRWVTKDFEFLIYTPFGEIPDPQDLTPAHALIPAVHAELTVDNTDGTQARTMCFALNVPDPGVRLLDTGSFSGDATTAQSTRAGFAWRNRFGVAGERLGWAEDVDRGLGYEREPFVFCRWAPDTGLTERTPHLLGRCPGIGLEVPAGEKRTLRLVLGAYLTGVVTTRLEGHYLYTKHFANLEQVLCLASFRADSVREASARLNSKLLASGLSPDQQFLIAHATRSYYGSTQLLDVGGQPYWVVNEGEYCMMNTLDLSVDHVFWELERNPWVVRNLLDNFVRHYSYVDQVKDPRTGELRPGGISFCHDQGVHNNFSPPGHSSYELPELNAVCFSYMTAEQLCNWVLIAATYVAGTGDVEWARQNRHVIDACYQSLINRGGEAGFVECDSSRCGRNGAEITTYDSLDHSLAQTRNNLYMAVKTWAAYLGIRRLYGAIGLLDTESDRLAEPEQRAYRVAEAVAATALPEGWIPAVFERDNAGFRSRILPAVEGLLYPLVWETTGTLTPHGMFASLLQALRRHTVTLLKDPERRNLFPDGGIKLSSTSNNSWMSKIALFQHVAREVFHLDADPAIADLFAQADAAHVRWQTEGPSAYWACSDQMVNGVAQGSRYYPRIITTALWLTARRARAAADPPLAADPRQG